MYEYNDSGIRTSKTVNGIKHDYSLNGSQIVTESWTQNDVEHVIVYLYDESGAPIGMQYRTSEYAWREFDNYYFEKNLFGDVVAIYNEAGTKIGSYKYDAWGVCTASVESTASTLEKKVVRTLNPFRYRGYYYDTETCFYYLQSRYYNPQWGRFLNADAYISTGTGLIGLNMYAYCNNNPVMNTDPSGDWPRWITATVAAVAAIVAVAAVANGEYKIAAVAGAIAVAATATLIVQSWHYDSRKQRNGVSPPTYSEAMETEGADDSISAACHQFTATDGPNIKVCWPDGREAIYDASGDLVTDSRDEGTYNYFYPSGGWSDVGHGIFDVLPWVIFGNSDSDPGPIINFPAMWLDKLIKQGEP